MAQEIIVEARQVVFREGDPGDRMFILLEGAVELVKSVDKATAVLKTVDQPNDFFGEMALIDGRPRSATAVAARRSRLAAVDAAAFESMILSNGKFALKIIKVLSERIRSSNERVEDLLETDRRERITRAMADFARRSGERIHDGSYKIRAGELRAWINARVGVPLEEVDAAVARLLKGETVAWAPSSLKTKEHLLLPEAFVRDHDRREEPRG